MSVSAPGWCVKCALKSCASAGEHAACVIRISDSKSMGLDVWLYLGDHLPVALEEGLGLRADGRGHAVLRHKVHILPLVLIGHLQPSSQLLSCVPKRQNPPDL